MHTAVNNCGNQYTTKQFW